MLNVTIPDNEKEVCLHLLSYFDIEGVKGDKALTEGQLTIFWALVFRNVDRLQIETCTQYGKSLTVALASIIISCIQKEVVSVIAPSTEKAKEIMRYYINHLGDSVIFSSCLDKKTKLERLKQEESKERIILNNGGGIYCLSTNEGNSKKKIESAMGKGSRITILDEACLISDQTEATIFRMIAGKGKNAFYCKIGNPFYTQPPYSHFYKTSTQYALISIDYRQALKEGRYTQLFIDEARGKPFFDVLYECKYPPRDIIDSLGFRYLITKEQLEAAFIDELPAELEGDKLNGADIGRGSDESAFVNKVGQYLYLESTNTSRDTMTQVNEIERIKADMSFVDDTGVGGGVTDRCKEKGLKVEGISWGSKAEDSVHFANKKAENYWEFKLWLDNGGKILRNEKFYELLEIKYKVNTSERIIIEPKESLLARGIKSPNVADATALVFNKVKDTKAGLMWL